MDQARHMAEGDPAKIISFKNRPSKQISETCLGCHAGREEHNNFRRGEHWRNDIGCTDCHSSHGTITGEHGFDTKQQFGDFDLTILPKNELVRFNVGFSPERYNGPAFTNYHVGGNEFNLLSELRSRANDFRFGADGKLGPIDYSFLQGFRRFRDDSFIDLGHTPGINVNPTTASLNSFHRDEPTRGKVNYTRLSLHSLVAQRLDLTARYIYSKATSNSLFSEGFTGVNWNARVSGWPPTPPNATPNTLNLGTYNITQDVERPNTIADFGLTWLATRKLRLSNTFRIEDFDKQTANGLR
jgi:hypothetical protein